MKKVLGLVLGLGLTLGLTSCSDEEIVCEVIYPTADVRLNVNANSSNVTGRDVNREDIPVTVKTIEVVATSLLTPIVREEDYTLVDDGSGEDGFIVGQVALGANDFIATTTPVASSTFDVDRFNVNATTEVERLAENKANVPYAVYNGSALNEEITGTNDFITVPMTTQNGRINTVIRMADDIRDDYTLELVTYTFNNSPVVKSITGNKSLSVYWSADDSTGGEIIYYQFKLIADNGFVAYETTETQTVIASTGINTLITVSAGSVQSESVGFNFVFQEWDEVDGN